MHARIVSQGRTATAREREVSAQVAAPRLHPVNREIRLNACAAGTALLAALPEPRVAAHGRLFAPGRSPLATLAVGLGMYARAVAYGVACVLGASWGLCKGLAIWLKLYRNEPMASLPAALATLARQADPELTRIGELLLHWPEGVLSRHDGAYALAHAVGANGPVFDMMVPRLRLLRISHPTHHANAIAQATAALLHRQDPPTSRPRFGMLACELVVSRILRDRPAAMMTYAEINAHVMDTLRPMRREFERLTGLAQGIESADDLRRNELRLSLSWRLGQELEARDPTMPLCASLDRDSRTVTRLLPLLAPGEHALRALCLDTAAAHDHDVTDLAVWTELHDRALNDIDQGD